MKSYEKPQVETLGTLHELTQKLNKVGSDADIYSRTTPLVGSFVQAPGH